MPAYATRKINLSESLRFQHQFAFAPLALVLVNTDPEAVDGGPNVATFSNRSAILADRE